jgi:hypothetical protein
MKEDEEMEEMGIKEWERESRKIKRMNLEKEKYEKLKKRKRMIEWEENKGTVGKSRKGEGNEFRERGKVMKLENKKEE